MQPASQFRPARGFEHLHHHWDAGVKSWLVHLLPGQYYVSSRDELITTVLGSCVSTCIRDPELGVGGMNHFMLPEDPRKDSGGNALRYGGFAIERLINELVKRGANRSRLEVKVFGGGQVIGTANDIGRANIEFVHEYLAEEQLAIVAEDTGGKLARRLRYHAPTGRALLKQLPMQDNSVRERERAFREQLRSKVIAGRIELF
jgi:chemotaxis protein CheD